jgi:hypothetical protein
MTTDGIPGFVVGLAIGAAGMIGVLMLTGQLLP